MGTDISKVKSVDLDMWTPDQMESIQKWGNKRANLYWEAHLKPGHIPPEHKIESFIRSKYESRRWAMDGPPPDPSVLESGSVGEPAPLPQEEPAVATRPNHVSNSNNSAARNSRVTSRQPQAHQLLSANFAKTAPAPNPTQHSTQPVQATQPSAPQDDLFSLDFHAPPATTTNVVPEQPRKDLKQDILSLYSTPAANPPSNPMSQFGSGLWSAPPQPQQPLPPTSMIGSAGIGAWGTSSGWTSPAVPPPQQNVWNTPALPAQQADLFNTNDVWGNSSSGPAAAPGTTSTKNKDDAFSDIWGSFK